MARFGILVFGTLSEIRAQTSLHFAHSIVCEMKKQRLIFWVLLEIKVSKMLLKVSSKTCHHRYSHTREDHPSNRPYEYPPIVRRISHPFRSVIVQKPTQETIFYLLLINHSSFALRLPGRSSVSSAIQWDNIAFRVGSFMRGQFMRWERKRKKKRKKRFLEGSFAAAKDIERLGPARLFRHCSRYSGKLFIHLTFREESNIRDGIALHFTLPSSDFRTLEHFRQFIIRASS